MITKSGGNHVQRIVPRHAEQRRLARRSCRSATGDLFANDTKLDKIVPTYEYTFGGPIVRDRLWFFTAGRFQKQEWPASSAVTNIPVQLHEQDTKRYEFNGTYSLNSNHRFQGTYINEKLDQLNNTFNPSTSMDLNSLEDRVDAAGPLHGQLQRRPDAEPVRRGARTRSGTSPSSARAPRRPTSSRARCSSTTRAAGATGRRRSAASARRKSATTRTSSSRATTSCRPAARVAQRRVRLRQLQRHPARPTTTSRAATTASSTRTPSSRARTCSPRVPRRRHDDHSVEPDLRS